ncbi:ParD-like family protein [Marinobacter pelagius]|uniref:ParD-like family protein n=1 Tax=Marinobacter sp. C7 TaxID=2951363 RepID=UPI001EF1047B|nr:ParD-like family protein [Marinobacter sp. C7]MCG7201565.1 ParD-like family protein [Marinobacter sp. C7]
MTTAVRLDDNLVRHAAAEGQVHRRSTPKQIEYWAEIGRAVAGEVSAEDLIAILQGIRKVSVEPVVAESVNSDELWAEVDEARESGELGRSIARGRTVYQASTEKPGYLEAIRPDGTREVGQFRNGRFEALSDRDDAA